MQKKSEKNIYKQTQNQPFQNIPINSEHKTQECQVSTSTDFNNQTTYSNIKIRVLPTENCIGLNQHHQKKV